MIGCWYKFKKSKVATELAAELSAPAKEKLFLKPLLVLGAVTWTFWNAPSFIVRKLLSCAVISAFAFQPETSTSPVFLSTVTLGSLKAGIKDFFGSSVLEAQGLLVYLGLVTYGSLG